MIQNLKELEEKLTKYREGKNTTLKRSFFVYLIVAEEKTYIKYSSKVSKKLGLDKYGVVIPCI